MHPRWEIPGFDFRPNGGWRVNARRVAATRRQLLASRSFSALNAPMARAMHGTIAPSPTAVTATHTVPALIFSYKSTDSALFMRPATEYQSVLFGTEPDRKSVV